MLHHISVAVNNPFHVAGVLAEILQGSRYPFPAHENSYAVVVNDGYGTAIDLLPADTQLVPGSDGVEYSRSTIPQTFHSVHAAISVAIEPTQIEQIANREGWLTRLRDRGPIKVIEFWVENKFLLEFLTPEMANEYVQFTTPKNLEAVFGQTPLKLAD